MLWPTVRVLLSILSSYALFHDCCNFFGGLYVTYPIILLKLRYLLGGFVMIILFDAKIKTAFVTIIMYNLCISHVFKAGNFCTLPLYYLHLETTPWLIFCFDTGFQHVKSLNQNDQSSMMRQFQKELKSFDKKLFSYLHNLSVFCMVGEQVHTKLSFARGQGELRFS